MLRWTLALLLLANLALAAWGQGWLGGNPGSAQREPGRLGVQLRPEILQWVPATEAALLARPLPVCREVGPLPDAAAQARAAARLQSLGVGAALQGWMQTLPGEWAVATRSAEDDDELDRKRQVLLRAGLGNLKAEKLVGEGDPSWVVSRHPQRAAAQAELNRLRDSRGLRALRLVTLREASQPHWLRSADWPRAQAQLRDALWPGEPRACGQLGAETALVSLSPVSISAARAAPSPAASAASR